MVEGLRQRHKGPELQKHTDLRIHYSQILRSCLFNISSFSGLGASQNKGDFFFNQHGQMKQVRNFGTQAETIVKAILFLLKL